MGMYTYVRGWIELSNIELTSKEVNKLLRKSKKLSPRADQCVSSTIFNMGFNMCPYLFIGGGIKNYDDDWDIYFTFLANNFDFKEFNIELKYEEDDEWTNVNLHEFKSKGEGKK